MPTPEADEVPKPLTKDERNYALAAIRDCWDQVRAIEPASAVANVLRPLVEIVMPRYEATVAALEADLSRSPEAPPTPDEVIFKRLVERQDAGGAIAVWVDPAGNPLHIPMSFMVAALGVVVTEAVAPSVRSLPPRPPVCPNCCADRIAKGVAKPGVLCPSCALTLSESTQQ